MRIKRSPVEFHNLLRARAACTDGQWQQVADKLRDFAARNGLYVNAPAFYQQRDDAGEREYTVYVPLGDVLETGGEPGLEDALELEGSLRPGSWLGSSSCLGLDFVADLVLEDALTFRVSDPDTLLEEAYLMLEACAKAQGYTLKLPYYHVCFDVFGEAMTDVIAPIEPTGRSFGSQADDGIAHIRRGRTGAA
jgi:hypothetical protein